jgi:hypothetical protein
LGAVRLDPDLGHPMRLRTSLGWSGGHIVFGVRLAPV